MQYFCVADEDVTSCENNDLDKDMAVADTRNVLSADNTNPPDMDPELAEAWTTFVRDFRNSAEEQNAITSGEAMVLVANVDTGNTVPVDEILITTANNDLGKLQ